MDKTIVNIYFPYPYGTKKLWNTCLTLEKGEVVVFVDGDFEVWNKKRVAKVQYEEYKKLYPKLCK